MVWSTIQHAFFPGVPATFMVTFAVVFDDFGVALVLGKRVRAPYSKFEMKSSDLSFLIAMGRVLSCGMGAVAMRFQRSARLVGQIVGGLSDHITLSFAASVRQDVRFLEAA